MTEGPLLWYLNRGTGVVLLVLLTASIVLGVLSRVGRPARGLPRFVTQDLHRNLALVSVLALVAHVATAVVDTYVDIRWWHAVVPWAGSYEPFWLGLGALALDVIVVIAATSLLRTRLGHGAWRAVHLTAWVAWIAAVAHTLGIGTDLREGNQWAVLPTVGCVLAVALAVTLRPPRAHPDGRVLARRETT